MSRVTSDPLATSQIDCLDGWRGLAIGFLLIGHFYPVPGINLGSIGVSLFFVLSGWLMCRLLFVQAVPIPTFYKRRVSRVFPVHFIFVATVVFLHVAASVPVSWAETIAAATFVINYFPGEPGRAIMPFGHIWSLAVEEQAYVVLSLLALAVRSGRLRATPATGFAALACVAFGTGYGLHTSGNALEFGKWLHSEVSAYGIFASSFLLLVLRRHVGLAITEWLAPVLLAVGIGMHWWSVPAPLRTFVGVGAFALSINCLVRAPGLMGRLLAFKPLRMLGLCSFSLYIWQQPFYLWVHRNGLDRELGILLALATGTLSYHLLEKPIRRSLNRTWARRT